MNENPIQEIVRHYQAQQGHNGKPLSLREMAARISEISPVSFQQLDMWKNGKQEPSVETLLVLWVRAPEKDWRYLFASDLLAAKIKDWLPEGKIGRAIFPERL